MRNGSLSLPIADALERLDVPFVFLTGQSRDLVPERYWNQPFLQKPCEATLVTETLADVMAAPA
ncbi:hypothetical protein D3C83_327340 [compost metagenome]